MKLITKDTDYAMRALIFLGSNKDKLFSVKEISEKLSISHQFLRRLLQVLNRNGILRSVKGKGGGFAINKNPEEIYLESLIRIFQGEIDIKHCMVRANVCPDKKTCLLTRKLNEMEKLIKKEIGNINIQALIGNKIVEKNDGKFRK
jgi:Rrf2 family protein